VPPPQKTTGHAYLTAHVKVRNQQELGLGGATALAPGYCGSGDAGALMLLSGGGGDTDSAPRPLCGRVGRCWHPSRPGFPVRIRQAVSMCEALAVAVPVLSLLIQSGTGTSGRRRAVTSWAIEGLTVWEYVGGDA